VTLVIVVPIASLAGNGPTRLVLLGLLTEIAVTGTLILRIDTWVSFSFWAKPWLALSALLSGILYLAGFGSWVESAWLGTMSILVFFDVAFLPLHVAHDYAFI
jgi:hypothetical protein